jgi:hypothetical protein
VSPPAPPRTDRFVLFFDFNQMTMSGRAEALREARRWVMETRQPDDEAMMAAYGSKMGLEILQEFTADRDALAAVIDRLKDDRSTIDHFPNEFIGRIEECDDDPRTCVHSARQEFWSGRQSLTALRRLLARLETTPGRKHLILFHQQGMLFPGEVYGVAASDHVSTTNQVAALATAAQTAIHTARVGGEGRVPSLPAAARALGTRFAEGTGGRANRGAGDLRAVLAAAGSRGRCLYVLGIQPPLQPDPSRIYTARITARGVPLAALPHIQFRTGARWLAAAAAVLEDPARARDVPLAAAIVPLAAHRGRWTVAIQVAVEEEALLQLPSSPDRSLGEWEAGAVLRHLDRDAEWEMLATSTLTRPADLRARPVILHERRMAGLRPGAYRLTAFVRDGNANLFGGAEAHLTLPDPRAGGAAGPLLVRRGIPRVVSALPLTGGRPAPETAGRGDTGPVPAAAPTLSPGEPAALLAWLCPGAGAATPAPRRFIARDDVPVFRLPPVAPEAAGDCFALQDAIPERALAPGRYVYTLEWDRGGKAVRLEQPIEVVEPQAAEGNP